MNLNFSIKLTSKTIVLTLPVRTSKKNTRRKSFCCKRKRMLFGKSPCTTLLWIHIILIKCPGIDQFIRLKLYFSIPQLVWNKFYNIFKWYQIHINVWTISILLGNFVHVATDNKLNQCHLSFKFVSQKIFLELNLRNSSRFLLYIKLMWIKFFAYHL